MPVKKKEESKDMKNLVLRNGVYYVKAMINGVVVKQSLHTSEHARALIERDLMLMPLKAHHSEARMLASVRRQLEGIKAEDEKRQAASARGLKLASVWHAFETDPTRDACKKQTLDEHQRNWRRFQEWLGKHYPQVDHVLDITQEMCRECAGDYLQQVKSTNTYNHFVSSIRFVLTSVFADDASKNPMRNIHKRKDDDCISREPFSDDELHAIFASMDDEFVRLSAIGLYTSLRFTSARNLTWEMFDSNLEYLTAVHDKTGADASQRVAAELREILSRVPIDGRVGLVCPSYASKRKANANVDYMMKLHDVGIQTHREVVGLNGKTRRACVKGFHSLRHTAITRALQNGATVSQVKRLAGHASEKMQERYTHLGADDAGKASAVIGKFW